MTYELTEQTGTAKCAHKAKRTALAAASNTAGMAASTFTSFDYENDMNHPINARIVMHAATVIFREQKVHTICSVITTNHLPIPRILSTQL
jgi:hypothetical protein